MKAALAIFVLLATPALAQEITKVRDANGNLPRDKGVSTNTNPTERAGQHLHSELLHSELAGKATGAASG
jgi:hypothetical protein